MQTVLDIIRHYSGAGKEDKDMEHKCEAIEFNGLKLYKENGSWFLDDVDAREYCLIHLLYCPFCGVKLDES